MANKGTATSAKVAPKGKSATAGTTSRKSSKIYCYIGPNIRGHLHTGQVFRGEKDDILKAHADLIKKHPLVKTLIIPGTSLAAARLKIKEPGTAHYANYRKLSRELLDAAQKNVKKEEVTDNA